VLCETIVDCVRKFLDSDRDCVKKVDSSDSEKMKAHPVCKLVREYQAAKASSQCTNSRR
jgi:hypothetical protein